MYISDYCYCAAPDYWCVAYDYNNYPLPPLIYKQINSMHSPYAAHTCHPGLEQSSLCGPCSGIPSVPLCIMPSG